MSGDRSVTIDLAGRALSAFGAEASEGFELLAVTYAASGPGPMFAPPTVRDRTTSIGANQAVDVLALVVLYFSHHVVDLMIDEMIKDGVREAKKKLRWKKAPTPTLETMAVGLTADQCAQIVAKAEEMAEGWGVEPQQVASVSLAVTGALEQLAKSPD